MFGSFSSSYAIKRSILPVTSTAVNNLLADTSFWLLEGIFPDRYAVARFLRSNYRFHKYQNNPFKIMMPEDIVHPLRGYLD